MPAGKSDLSQAFFDLFRLLDIGCRNSGHSHNRIHGGSDIMAHIGKELALCPVCILCFFLRCIQFPHLMAGNL